MVAPITTNQFGRMPGRIGDLDLDPLTEVELTADAVKAAQMSLDFLTPEERQRLEANRQEVLDDLDGDSRKL